MVTGVGVVRGCSLGRFEGVFAWVFAGLWESKWMRERQTQWLPACSAFGAGGEQGRVVVAELLCCLLSDHLAVSSSSLPLVTRAHFYRNWLAVGVAERRGEWNSCQSYCPSRPATVAVGYYHFASFTRARLLFVITTLLLGSN